MLTVKVVQSRKFGKKSKVMPPAILYVPVDAGDLSNKYVSKIAYHEDDGISKFLENFPQDEIDKLVLFCKEREVKELWLGEENYPYSSHAYLMAESIHPTTEQISLSPIMSSSEPLLFSNAREFERAMLFYSPSSQRFYKNQFVQKYPMHEKLFGNGEF